AIEDPAAIAASRGNVCCGIKRNSALVEPGGHVAVQLVDTIVELIFKPGRGGFGVPDVEKLIVAKLDGMVELMGRGYLQAVQRGKRGRNLGVDDIGEVLVYLDDTVEGVGKTGGRRCGCRGGLSI